MAEIDPTAAKRIAERLASVADEPAEATSDGQSARNQPIPDLIALDKYVAGKTALSGSTPGGGVRSGWGCVRAARAKPPGAS